MVTLKDHLLSEKATSSVKGKELCSSSMENNNPWPFRIKLTTDHLRWDSLKISPSIELEEHILAKLDEVSHLSLDQQRPIEISIYDMDTCETYKVNFAKKESFWFEPFPDIEKINQRMSSTINTRTMECLYDRQQRSGNEFFYSIEPFREIQKKRNLRCDVEIGFRWSGSSETSNQFEFSVLHVPWMTMVW